MFTRRTATVIISAPEASRALTMTAGVDVEATEQFGYGQRSGDFELVAVQGNRHGKANPASFYRTSTPDRVSYHDIGMDRGRGFDRAGAVAWYQRNRERSRELFDLV